MHFWLQAAPTELQIWPIAGKTSRIPRGRERVVPVPALNLADLLLLSQTLVDLDPSSPKDLTDDECHVYLGRACPRQRGTPSP